MMSTDPLLQARDAIERGDKLRARLLMRDLILQDPRNEQAWIVLAQVVEKRYQTIDCLERVLQINPGNKPAQRALAVLQPRGESSGTIEIGIAGADLSTRERYEPVHTQLEAIQVSDSPHIQRRTRANWPLVIGMIIVLAIFLLAVFGPQLAAHDPLETSLLLKVGEGFELPPYPMLTPGFPLGSDGEGRDLLSRILWGIQPTMILVLVVASVRLIIGTLIGLVAGWSNNWPGRILDGVIGIAISIPVIIVALGGIAAVGVDLGIWAFIIALSLTGWVETARLVREQTQILRKQVYIEAARSLGGTQAHILRWHVLRQVLSLLWMLFAFEISSTLLLVAALGFLGYYIGGDIWISVSDAAAAAISGMPELGQLLATTPLSVNRPWPLIAIGAFVFLVVLGFNLLGEGLRRRIGPYEIRRRSALENWIGRAQLWADEELWWPLSNLASRKGFRLAGLGIVFIAVLSSLLIFGIQARQRGDRQQIVSVFAQEQQWASSRHDPYGTRWTQFLGPDTPQVRWTFTDEAGFTGGPVIARDGTLYISTNAKLLYALNPGGEVLWQTQLASNPVGTPGLNSSGEIFITDIEGGLTALDQRGELIWYFQPERIKPATTGPVIDPKGNAYYVQALKIQAVSAAGEEMWESQPGGDALPTELIKLSPEGDMLFWGSAVLDTGDGSLIEDEDLPEADRYFSGADGEIYLVEGHEVRRWDPNDTGQASSQPLSWDYQKFSISNTSKDAGVTPDGIVWLFYTGFARSWGFGEDTRIIWLDKDSNLLGNAFYEIRNSQVIAVDQEARIYTCGNLDQGYGLPECQAFSAGAEEPVWKITLEDSREIAGGALVSGRLYAASRDGTLYAIGNGQTPRRGEELASGFQEDNIPVSKDEILDRAGEPLGPSVPSARKLLSDESGFSGGAVVAADGTAYIMSIAGSLTAIDEQGEIIWQVTLDQGGVGSPALGQEDEIYVVDKEGGLSAFSKDGEMLWHFTADPGMMGIAGPKVNPAGVIYYTLGTPGRASIQAVSKDGKPVWLAPVDTDLYFHSPELNADGDLVFFRGEIFSSEDGTLLDSELPFEVDRFFAGEDGGNYLLAEGTVAAWEFVEDKLIVREERVISPRGKPLEVGVTPEGVVWMLYARESYWFTRDGQALGVSEVTTGWIDSAAGVDLDYTIYACGRDSARYVGSRPACYALSLSSSEPVWISTLSNSFEDIAGSSFALGRIYIATEEGNFYLIEQAP